LSHANAKADIGRWGKLQRSIAGYATMRAAPIGVVDLPR